LGSVVFAVETVGLCSATFDVAADAAVDLCSVVFDDAAAADVGLCSVLLVVAAAADDGLAFVARLDRVVLVVTGFFVVEAVAAVGDAATGTVGEDAIGNVESNLGEVADEVSLCTFSFSSFVDAVLTSSFG
jgi:hypothetical protein